VPAGAVEGEREIARNRAREEGKPEAAWDKIVDGRVEKYLDEVVLMRQAYIRDESKTIKELVSESVGTIGENIVVRRFQRWELGEHVEK